MSEENNSNSPENAEKNTPDAEKSGPPAGATATETSSVEALQEEITKLKNDYLYLRAEFDNYRKQAIKERSDLVKFGGERIARDLLDTLDIFESALATDVSPETLKNFVSGIELTAQQLRAALTKHNIQEIPALGQAFDPYMHEALGSEPSDSVTPGHVSRVFKKAYKYHDKILRPAQVIVAKESTVKEK